MVSTCFRGRSLLGACLEKTQKKRRSQPVDTTPPKKKKSHRIVLCHIVSPRFFPPPLQVTLGVILCPNVAWSGAALHLKMRGTIYNPSVQIFTQRDKSTRAGRPKKESPVPGTVFARRAIYSYDRSRGEEASQRGRWRGRWEERREGWKRGEWKGWPVRAERRKPEERGQMDRRAAVV